MPRYKNYCYPENCFDPCCQTSRSRRSDEEDLASNIKEFQLQKIYNTNDKTAQFNTLIKTDKSVIVEHKKSSLSNREKNKPIEISEVDLTKKSLKSLFNPFKGKSPKRTKRKNDSDEEPNEKVSVIHKLDEPVGQNSSSSLSPRTQELKSNDINYELSFSDAIKIKIEYQKLIDIIWTSCFRVLFGPSLDETIVASVDTVHCIMQLRYQSC
ncbi:uncharacterized protein LOC115890462 [Sitophilus oryzae]|uniref:Uncharacterized protein LOC115890462 n=1 Tax=Sitophilus oryzae TaxID=7048 RepID=A0A6J2YTP7_SITOR|nr:uncharacterized protein LOC115890462 [Sitophilus oryzae]